MSYTGKTDWKDSEIVYASDMNRVEQGIVDLDTQKADKSITAPVTLTAADWVEDTENGWWTQGISNPAIVDGVKIDISFDAAQIVQLTNDGASIMIVNNNGVATAYAFGAAPTVDLVGFIEIREVTEQ